MTRAGTPKLSGYAALAALGLFAGFAFGRPELVVLATPFAVVLTLGLLSAETPTVELRLDLPRQRALEGDEIPGRLLVASSGSVERLEVGVAVPEGLEATGDSSFGLRLGAGEERQLDLRVRCVRWGAYTVGRAGLAAFDRFGLFVFEAELDRRVPLRVYPREERLRAAIRPHETQPYAGNFVARQKGEGIEFVDLRPYAPGDRVRRINWKATARRGTLIVNEHHPERNASVVLLLDSFAEASVGPEGTLDQAVRATASLADALLRRRDQVGLLSFGGSVNWLEPAMGVLQLYRIVDALLETEVVFSYVWRDLRVIPGRVLPPQALVIALTPMLDDRILDALVDVRGRGADLAVIEITPDPFVRTGGSEAAQIAFRIWKLQRAAVRSRFLRLGVPVVQWRSGGPLEPVLEEVTAFRRYARAMRV